jgi:hypothetical protein
MRAKDRLSLVLCLLHGVLVPQRFGLPAFPQMKGDCPCSQPPIQMLFAYLHWAKGGIPPAPLAWPGHRLDILNHHV